jgi:hypothetical protein
MLGITFDVSVLVINMADIVSGESQRYIFGITDLTFRMLALRLDFR